jgi:hypothetical protein
MNKGVILGLSAIAVIGGIVAYRYFVPPTFVIRESDGKNHKGTIEFGGVSNSFGNTAFTQVGRMGWELQTKINPDGTTTFNLLKNGKFIKQLGVR